MAQTARISHKSDLIIQELVTLTGSNKIEIIESALESYRHQERMRRLNESFYQLRSNESGWKEEQEERDALEGTLGDGLEEE